MAVLRVFLLLVLGCPCLQAAITISLNSTGKWPGGVVPYRFQDRIRDFSKLTNIIIAMQQVEEFTGGCIRFEPRTDQKDYVIIQDESYTQDQTCFSYVGRTGAWQPVRLSSECLESSGSVLHVLSQVLGFYPESNRPDRDQYIEMQWDNIHQEKLAAYATIPFSYQMHLFNPDQYDFASITHATQTQYSRDRDNLKTWTLRRGVPHPGVEIDGSIGQRIGFSIGDVAALRFLYNCNYTATVTPDLACNGGASSTANKPSRGRAAGYFFCRCAVNNATGEAFYTGQYCKSKRCYPSCSSRINSECSDSFPEPGWPRCVCKSGWKGDSCEEYDCRNPCTNGGVCIGPNTCKCPPEYPNNNCRAKLKCSKRCRNGGQCVGVDGSARCRCQIGWSGETCNEPRCEQPCLNNGQCIAPDVCRCPTGFSGLRCQNANVTFGLPCTTNYECTDGWGDKHSYCNLNSSCPSVNRTCVCQEGYGRLPSGGICRKLRRLGERCSWDVDLCMLNGECIQGRCQCDTIRGWVNGPLYDCVKAERLRRYVDNKCQYFDDCLYNKTCGSDGSCSCSGDLGLRQDKRTGGHTCRPRVVGDTCSNDLNCQRAGVGAECLRLKTGRRCTCSQGVPYEYLVDRFTVGTTCIPPFPRRWGERCSVDFSKQPQYGPCERGLVCELCPLTTDDYRCQDFRQPIIGAGSKANSCWKLVATAFLISNLKK